MHLAYRWFCRLDLDERVPDHSTFSVNRHGRFRSSNIFRQLFEAVVRACMDAGVRLQGEGFAIDASVRPGRPMNFQIIEDLRRDQHRRLLLRSADLQAVPTRTPMACWAVLPEGNRLVAGRQLLEQVRPSAQRTPRRRCNLNPSREI